MIANLVRLTSVKVLVNSKFSKATTQKTLQDSDNFQNCSKSKKDTLLSSFSTHAHPHTRGGGGTAHFENFELNQKKLGQSSEIEL